MRQATKVEPARPVRARTGRWQRWPDWTTPAAGAWSLLYGLLGLWWALGGAGFPFGEGDPEAAGSLLAGVSRAVGAPVVAALGLAEASGRHLPRPLPAMVRPWGRRLPRRLLTAFAWATAATLLLVVPDARVLMLLGYLPALVFRFGFENLDWPVLNQLLAIAGGALWAAAALAFQRGGRHACVHCGRTGHATAEPRWGRWASPWAFPTSFWPSTRPTTWPRGSGCGASPWAGWPWAGRS